MNSVAKISLIAKSYAVDSIGVPIPDPDPRQVYAYVSSVNQSEFYKAGQAGLKPYACYTVRLTEYNGEDEIEDNGKRYTVYRTYNRTDGRVELYVQKRKGSK